jgi:hypothetical protein
MKQSTKEVLYMLGALGISYVIFESYGVVRPEIKDLFRKLIGREPFNSEKRDENENA